MKTLPADNTTAGKEIPGITFARAFSAIGILIYHFLAGSRSGIEFMHNYPNGTWGAAYVSVFLLISGAVMYYSNSEISSPGRFWYKRAKAILPPFYIAYAFCFLENLFNTGDPFSHGQPWCLIFSLLGLDGYLEGTVPTYYFVGEWFLGAIIIMYAIYPLLLWLFKKNTLISGIVVVGLYIWMLYSPVFEDGQRFRSVFSCLFCFWTGMLVMKYRSFFLGNIWITIISLLFLVAANFFAIPMNLFFVNHLYGFALFFLLYAIGERVMKSAAVSVAVRRLSALSYPIFLVHHQIVFKVLGYQNPTSKAGAILMLLVTILLSILAAVALEVLTKYVLNSKTYKKLEAKII